MSTTKDLFLNHPISGAVGDAATRINAERIVDMMVHDEACVRVGDRPGGWSEVGTKSLEYVAETRIEDADLRIHAWLKRHADNITIAWHVSAARDELDQATDPKATTMSVSVRESGFLTDVDEHEILGAFERISRRAATRCLARVAAAWGVVEP